MTPFAERFFNARAKDVEASPSDRVGTGGGEADGKIPEPAVRGYSVVSGGTAESKDRVCFCTPYVAQQIRDEKDRLYAKNHELHARAQRAEAENISLSLVIIAAMALRETFPINRPWKPEEIELATRLNAWHRRWIQNDET